MRKVLLASVFLVIVSSVEAQSWVKDSKNFTVTQSGSEDNYAVKLPSSFIFSDGDDFAYGTLGAVSLSLHTGIDLTASVLKLDLVGYANGMADKDLYYMEKGIITNKVIATKPVSVNGISMLEISFNYEERDPLKAKKGKAFMYLLRAKGDSGVTGNDNDLVVTLLFDYDESKAKAGSYTLHKEILKTIKKDE